MASRDSHLFEIEAPHREPTRVEKMIWPTILLLAYLLFELTANVTLSILVACVNFGWEDFRTSFWLRATDPVRPRAYASFWFYIASGVWKTAIVPIAAVAMVTIVLGIFSPQGMNFRQLTDQLLSALLVGAVASTLLVMFVVLAIAMTARAGVRVWVHHELHRCRRAKCWPPICSPHLGLHNNRARAIAATAILFLTIALPPVLLAQVFQMPRVFRVPGMLVIVFGVPLLAMVSYADIQRRFFARNSAECWPEVEWELDA